MPTLRICLGEEGEEEGEKEGGRRRSLLTSRLGGWLGSSSYISMVGLWLPGVHIEGMY